MNEEIERLERLLEGIDGDHEPPSAPPAGSFEALKAKLAEREHLGRLHEPGPYLAALGQASHTLERLLGMVGAQRVDVLDLRLLAKGALDRILSTARALDEGLSEEALHQRLRRSLAQEAVRYHESRRLRSRGRGYTPVVPIGDGPFGTIAVGRAHSPAVPGGVALLKMLHPAYDRERGLIELFRREAEVAARCLHPNLATVHGESMIAGRCGVAMEHIEGEHLHRLLEERARRRGSGGEALRLVTQILRHACDGLEASHAVRGSQPWRDHTEHRDLSPHNIFVTGEGEVKVVDFDIVIATDQYQQTGARGLITKRAYVAPERILGGGFDPRMDVWTLGVILWEAAAGRPLFERRTTGTVGLAICEQEIPPPSRYDPEVPPELDVILARALCRDPDARYPSVRELGHDLGHFVEHQGPAPGPEELREWVHDLAAPVLERRREQREEARRGRRRRRAGSSWR